MAILISAMAAPWLFSEPCSAAKLVETSVYYQPPTSSGTRQPRTGSGGKFITVPGLPLTLNPNISNTQIAPTNAAQKLGPISGITYTLVYINVSGGAGGSITVFPDANGDTPASVTVHVQNPPQDITVENVYLPTGGPPCPPNTVCGTSAAAVIDEFSEDLSMLIDDTFVSVFSPPNSTSPDTVLTRPAM